ncbi:MAG: class II fumarate hydratase [Candidatus Sungbacteria bacterium]|nr:class II fumarate hydratase [bacterium]MDZ4260477.1 class II fumarate hydratase [Candidatus Sungbacteria bacterium]
MRSRVRIETDSMGTMRVPIEAYYGASTRRAVENFPISGLRFSRQFIAALGMIKKHAARANASLGLLPKEISRAIQKAACEVTLGTLDSHFVVDIFQTGSGTSTNMNANEVIANRALEIMGKKRGDKSIHPNDHVNLGQSSNDVIPSAIRIAALHEIVYQLIPAFTQLRFALLKKSKEFKHIWKIGRTHLNDAISITLGQEFSGYATQMSHVLNRFSAITHDLGALPLGGTAVGTGINTHKKFALHAIKGIAKESKLKLRETANHFEAQASIDSFVQTSAVLRTAAISLIKIANDIRWLASGPRCGLNEITLPATQPGSSIMPGKINPVMCEMVIQVGAHVIGNDAAIAFSGTQGNFELNTMLPVVAYNLLQSITLLTNACRVFLTRCIHGIKANREVCEQYIEKSLSLVTLLVPRIGYDKASAIAHVAYKNGRTIREVAYAMSGLPQKEIDNLLVNK